VIAPDWLLTNKVTVPYGRRGRAKVTRYTLTQKRADAINWRIVLHSEERAWSYPGRYTGLCVDGIMVMSDEAKEIEDHLPFISKATGRVLLTGLGLGMCLQALLRKPETLHVTVVEECADVVHLVAGHYLAMFGSERFNVVNADAFNWQPEPGTFFDYAFHDIWPLAMAAYWPQHKSLLTRFAPYVREQESWRGEWMRQRWEAQKIV
jgi:hypothetical protein